MRHTTVVLAVAFALLAAGISGGAALAAAEPTAGLDPDTVLLRVDLRPDGTAHWHVEYRVRLDGTNESRAFAQYRQDVAAEPAAYRQQFADLMRTALRRAENDTGREMTIRNVSVGTERRGPPAIGVVVYEFEWTAFAETDGATVRAGDALSEFYASEETTLMFTWPETYRASSVRPPSPDEDREGVAGWTGPMQFAPGEPRLVLVPRETPTATASPVAEGSSLPLPPSLAGAGAVALLVLGGWTIARRDGLPGRGSEGGPTSTGAGDGDGVASEGGAGDEAPPATELLSNEERVLSVLREHGGRLKQGDIADELGWKAPKTSKVVQDLRDEEEVTVFRLGRENVVSLPDADPRNDDGE